MARANNSRKNKRPIKRGHRRTTKSGNSRPRTQARGKKQKGAQAVPPLNAIPPELNYARRHFMVTRSVASAAVSNGVSPARIRRLLTKYKLAKWDRKKRKWRITDKARREVSIVSEGKARTIVVSGFGRAQLAGAYAEARKRFVNTNDPGHLTPFENQTITDVDLKRFSFETRPNVLLRLANIGSDADMKIYRLID